MSNSAELRLVVRSLSLLNDSYKAEDAANGKNESRQPTPKTRQRAIGHVVDSQIPQRHDDRNLCFF